MAFLSLISPFHLRLALSGSIVPYLPPLMTDFSASLPSSPNTKPEPRHHQCRSCTNPGLSGPSCASDPLPKPDSRQRCGKYMVKSSKIHWNSHKRNLSAFYRILLILPLILTYHVVSNEMRTNKLKFTQICMMDLAHLSTNPLYGLPLTHFTISPSTSSVWIHIALPPPLMTDSSASSPSSPNTKPEPLQGQCCYATKSGLSGSSCASDPLPEPYHTQRSAKYVVKSSEILWNSHSHKKSQRLLPHSSHTSAHTHISCGLPWNEKNKLKFTQSAWWTRHICFTISPSTSSVWIHIALPPPLMTDFSASSPSSPNTKPEPRHHQCRSCTNPGSSGPSCASVPLPKPDSRQRCAKYMVKSFKIHRNSHKRNLSAFYRILLILPLILTYHVVSNEMKRTSSNSLKFAWWTWHISAPIV